MLKLFLAILVGKLIFLLSRFLGRGGGSAAPGYYALKIEPDLVTKLAAKIEKQIIVTGTNGKTTTSRMISQIATDQGFKVLQNDTGSNLERGIVSTLISNINLFSHKFSQNLAIWELDEAAFNSVAPKLKAEVILFLNAFRDQLDRYGEVDSVVKKWQQTLAKVSSSTKLLINGDDENTANLKHHFDGLSELFGLPDNKIVGESHKKTSQKLDYQAVNIKPVGLEFINFDIKYDSKIVAAKSPVPGIYHVYDFLAAFIVGKHLNIANEEILNSLENFKPAFGRVEKIVWTPLRWPHEMEGYIFLIKNPVGASEVFKTIAMNLKPEDRLLIALNDNFADGKDVSWIWDAEFEVFSRQLSALSLICSGIRAQDLAVRLKYAGFDKDNIIVENNLEKAFKITQNNLKGRLFILPTYTALLELQNILVKKGIKKHYWKGDK